MSPKILVTTDRGIAHIVLNNPTRLNAIDFDAGRQYRDACVASVSAEDVSAIVISASGPAWCVGGDLLAMANAEVAGSQVTDAAHVIHEGIAALVESSVPVVAAVRGAVAGGGIGLMLAADYVVAGPDLRVTGSYSDVGLTPDLGVSTLLTRAVGERRALEVLLTKRELDAAAALEWGMVAEVADDPESRAMAIAGQWAGGASRAFGDAKRLVHASSQRDFADSLADEARSIGEAFESDDARQRIAAFVAASAARGGKR
ncbi:enoyl-CoA hydratase/isomerase family protein [Demequina oxidasica]|uniref:enoyl-CoA hydratase/isomerase family protein n=1 Tax=Demequina oxidasica TaxID=676199 RepID=UPI000781AD14|nr:enoyl-CoA hydratase-related protein [Demequina oxidasica]